jgi:hypothetical protein
VTTYTAGLSFSELPGNRHNVSASASQTKLAKFLAVFVVDTNNTRLTIPLGNRGLTFRAKILRREKMAVHQSACSSLRKTQFLRFAENDV